MKKEKTTKKKWANCKNKKKSSRVWDSGSKLSRPVYCSSFCDVHTRWVIYIPPPRWWWWSKYSNNNNNNEPSLTHPVSTHIECLDTAPLSRLLATQWTDSTRPDIITRPKSKSPAEKKKRQLITLLIHSTHTVHTLRTVAAGKNLLWQWPRQAPNNSAPHQSPSLFPTASYAYSKNTAVQYAIKKVPVCI